MKKGVLITMFVLLLIASIFVYKLNLEKESVNKIEETNELTFDKITNIYYWVFVAVGTIIILFIIFFLIGKRV
ncbi:hypothetical protein LCGC14_2806430 [marine sediment metagenome]|uniref:Uncharacterized protein n=1 Tax=marine sediment metagenome TaxID=412755 RepID=A0A0F8Z7Y8_9ZZZZ|nr:hypothetical protein [Candidatus Pacearchaeota archaeon]